MQADFEKYAGEIQQGIVGDEKEASRPRLETFTARELQQMYIPPTQWICEGLIPRPGLGLLAGAPKAGKSWLVADLCAMVAEGRSFLGFKTNKTRALYISLEDSKGRMKSRIQKQSGGIDASDNVDLCTSCGTTSTGLYDELETYIVEHPDAGLICIDVFQKIRSASGGSSTNAYQMDYNEVGRLKQFADNHNITLLLVHHLRKMKDDDDPFNQIAGSNGIFGTSDFAFVLQKEKRGDNTAMFHVTGRDIVENTYTLSFSRDLCIWLNQGNADEIARKRAQQEYEESPIVQTIKHIIKDNPDGCYLTASQIMDTGRAVTGAEIAGSPRELSNRLYSLNEQLYANDGITHETRNHGNAGKKHRFYIM
jgi:RecA-family ATPase